MVISRSKKLKYLSIIWGALLLTGVFVVVPTKAPVTEPIIMWAVVTENPGFGYYGGYHDILQAIKGNETEGLRAIGIDLRIAMYDDFTWYDTVWEPPTWNVTGDANGDPTTHIVGVDGWDFTTCEWWLNPTSYIWMDELAYSWATPPTGYNVMSWNDPKTDSLWQTAQTTLDPIEHKEAMWDWQEQFMHNPPVIPIYYADMMTARASYVDGFDEVAWVYDSSHLDIDETKFNSVAPAARKAIGSNTLLWGAVEDIFYWFPLGCNTYTEEMIHDLKQGLLYRTTRENMDFPPSGNYYVELGLASALPTWYQKPDGRWVGRITLKSGLNWTDGVEFNATDVAFSFNAVLDKRNKSYAYQDFAIMLDTVEVFDRYTADFVYLPGMGPDYDLAGYIAHNWAIAMLPWHQLRNENLAQWKSASWGASPIPESDPLSTDMGIECLGPYVPTAYDTLNRQWIEFKRREPYFLNALGYSLTLPEKFIIKLIPDDGDRLAALQALEVDLVEYPLAAVETWESMIGWPTHEVYTYHYPASHPLWMNQMNPILSNRYVRLAIAHAIPYPRIFNEILPGWGVSTAYPGKTFILPIQDAFNTELGNYEYDIEKAKDYMNMWRYSQATLDPSKGPRGDHDFSGYVGVDDFPIWAKCIGKTPSQWTWKPGNPIDPDNDNDADVDVADYTSWYANYGKRYPFNGAW